MSITIEILISTMFRENLDFLDPIFVNNSMEDFNFIVVNQTSKDKIIKSNETNIKVINSFERGSPASRNLAIKNATSDICLMADDDIVYKPNLKQIILEAYQKYPYADMISFEAIDEHGNLYTNYYPEGKHNGRSLKKIYTLVITFKREVFKQNQIFFNHYFGVGSVFRGSTEYVFLRYAFDKGLTMMHTAKTVVMHPSESSGRLMGSDEKLFSVSAMKYRFLGNLAYLWLIKYVFFIWRHNYIKSNEINYKFKLGLKGIAVYKQLKLSGKIDQIYDGKTN